MNKEELESKIKELENALNQLKEELNKPVSKCWKPKCGDTYHYILSSGAIVEETWQNGGADCFRYSIGNCFKTQEETEFEVEKLKVIAELKRFAKEHNKPLDWKNCKQSKWAIRFVVDIEEFSYICFFTYKVSDIYFSSKELAQQAVAEIGEERIKKYYFEIE